MHISTKRVQKFKCRGLCLMAMYSKVDLYGIYKNLSDEDKDFNLVSKVTMIMKEQLPEQSLILL